MNFGSYGIPKGFDEVDFSVSWVALDDEVKVWAARAQTAGGTFTGISAQVADSLIKALKRTSFNTKVLWLAPLLGANIITARVPLRDSLNAGIMVNGYLSLGSFVDADFSENNGIVSSVLATKLLGTNVLPSQLVGSTGLAAGYTGGIGYWEKHLPATASQQPIGMQTVSSPQERYVIDYRTTPLTNLNFGQIGITGASAVGLPTAPTIGHYYGQKQPGILTLYKNGTPFVTTTVTDTPTHANANPMAVLGTNTDGTGTAPVTTCAVAYFTDGTLTENEIEDMHLLLVNFLMTPTGR